MTDQVEETASSYGLNDDWQSVLQILEEIIPVYDRTNRFISLGADLNLRQKGIELLISKFSARDFSLLDLGCGTGAMTILFRKLKATGGLLLLVDPILKMMRVATTRTGEPGVLAIYEYLPFRKEAVDAAMAGFSLRDARDLSSALDQINSLLKPGGKFLIVDLSKPDSKVRNLLISVYWRTLAPLIAFLSSGRLGLKFGALAKTYERLPTISQFVRLANQHGFKVEDESFSMMGGACVILLRKDEL